MAEERIFTKNYFKKLFRFSIIVIIISILLSFFLGGFRVSILKISDFLFIVGGLIAILGGVVLTGTWMHIKKILRNTAQDEEVDAKSLEPHKFSYACLIVGVINIVLAALIVFIPMLFI